MLTPDAQEALAFIDAARGTQTFMSARHVDQTACLVLDVPPQRWSALMSQLIIADLVTLIRFGSLEWYLRLTNLKQ